jgi:transcriptional regulator with AAA-type ATPase domain
MESILRFHRRTLIVADKQMEETIRLASRAASTQAPVLLCGESGTGKELIARFIHEKSGCSHGPFVSVNCAAIPDGLIESEFFGFEKGAFTGAITQQIGKFERANGGTLTGFLADVHLYENHLNQANQQLMREPMDLPSLILSDRIVVGLKLEEITPEDIELKGYNSYTALKGEMAV